jgi:hypothetical protein
VDREFPEGGGDSRDKSGGVLDRALNKRYLGIQDYGME